MLRAVLAAAIVGVAGAGAIGSVWLAADALRAGRLDLVAAGLLVAVGLTLSFVLAIIGLACWQSR